MPSRSDRIARLERIIAERSSIVDVEQRAAEILDAAGWPPCPLTERWRAGDRSVAPIVAMLGPRLVATVTEIELQL